jgi:hypothetical protein
MKNCLWASQLSSSRTPVGRSFALPLVRRRMTTRQAGAVQLFGSYPSRADGLCLSELDHFQCFLPTHGIVNVSCNAIGSRQQGRIDLVNGLDLVASSAKFNRGFLDARFFQSKKPNIGTKLW